MLKYAAIEERNTAEPSNKYLIIFSF